MNPVLQPRTLAEIRVRDPFILPDAATGTYYLVSSLRVVEGYARPGVGVYTSQDLQMWSGPFPVFEVPADFWSQDGIWAPEMHTYGGKYYLFLTFNTQDPIGEQWPDWPARVKRGSQMLVADSPRGPFRPFHNRAHTPADQMTLDGTLWVEEGVPYMVYCHEWVQLQDGTVEAVRLRDDLSDVVGEPVTLFRGSEAPWRGAVPVRSDAPRKYAASYVTDGPFLYRSRSGKLLMIWSSFGVGGYTTGIVESASGSVLGPWHQQVGPLFASDGGHGMLFQRFDGQLMLTLHQPNTSPDERARLFAVEDTGETLRIVVDSASR